MCDFFSVRITGDSYQGFLLQAKKSDGSVVGSWSNAPSNTRVSLKLPQIINMHFYLVHLNILIGWLLYYKYVSDYVIFPLSI